jgi:hypothetical protein
LIQRNRLNERAGYYNSTQPFQLRSATKEQANDPAISRGSRNKACLYPLSEGADAWHYLEKPLHHRRAKD